MAWMKYGTIPLIILLKTGVNKMTETQNKVKLLLCKTLRCLFFVCGILLFSFFLALVFLRLWDDDDDAAVWPL